MNCIKIAHYQTELEAKNQIGNVLKLIYELIGLRADNWPSNNANMAIADYVFTKYKNLAVQEIKFAFDLAFHNRLSGIKLEHYQSFSVPYLASILQAYIEYKKGSIEKVDKYFAERKLMSDKTKDYARSDQAIKQMIISSYAEVLLGKEISYAFSMETHYEILTLCGLIDFTTAEKLKILAEAEEEIKKQIAKYEQDIKDRRRTGKDVQSISFVYEKLKEDINNQAYMLAKSKTFKMQLKRMVTDEFKMDALHDRINNTVCWVDPGILNTILDIKRRIGND